MAKPVKKPAAENLNDMLERIRQENEALHRLIEAIKNLPLSPDKSKNSINQ
jgi:hypothetical protein